MGDASGFVAKDHRLFEYEGADSAVGVVADLERLARVYVVEGRYGEMRVVRAASKRRIVLGRDLHQCRKF